LRATRSTSLPQATPAPDRPSTLRPDITIQGLTGNSGITIRRATSGSLRIFKVDYIGTLALNDLTIADGLAQSGGGIINFGRLRMTRCTLRNNTATFMGGGLNSGGGGSSGQQVTLTNCTFANNRTQFSGGALANDASSTMSLTNVTVSGNVTTYAGGFGGLELGGTVTAVNTIVAGNSRTSDNSPADINGSFDASSHHNLIGHAGSSGGLSNGVNNNIVGANPLLNALAFNGGPTQTMALSPGSPALHAAALGVLSEDQRGISRPQGAGADIGAYELVDGAPAAFTSPTSTVFLVGLPKSFNVTANGVPSPTFSLSGALPAGVSFTSDGLLSGTPASGSEGTYLLTITASNSAGFTTQTFTLTVVRGVVVTTATDEDNGSTDPTLGTGTSLREAINYANGQSAPQTVMFAPSLAGQSIDLTIVGDSNTGSAFVIQKDLTIRGLTGDSGITIRRAITDSLRPFYVNSGATLTLSDLTIADGSAARGGGIYTFGTLRMNRCTLRNNTATTYGGGLSNGGGANGQTVTLTQLHDRNNRTSAFGGGIASEHSSSTTTLTNVTVVGNTTTGNFGTGGIYILNGTVFAENSIVAGNTRPAGASDIGGNGFGGGSHHNLIGIGGNGGLTNGVNGNVVGVADPRLGPLAFNGGPTQTIALLSGSPGVQYRRNCRWRNDGSTRRRPPVARCPRHGRIRVRRLSERVAARHDRGGRTECHQRPKLRRRHEPA
jgi:CSLREA domain-containing protein